MNNRQWTCYKQQRDNLWSVRSENNERIAFDLEEECAKELTRRWNAHEGLVKELEEIVSYTRIEGAALREIELESIEKLLAAAKETPCKP